MSTVHDTIRPPSSRTRTSSQPPKSARSSCSVYRALEVAPVVLVPDHRGHERTALRAQDASDLVDRVAGIVHVVERLDAHDEVERPVLERQDLVRDHVGDAVRIALHVEADEGRPGGRRSSQGRDPHQTSRTSSMWVPSSASASRSPAVSAVRWRWSNCANRRTSTRTANRVEVVGRRDRDGPPRCLHCRPG